MAKDRVFPLDAVRTDGWFERIGEGIGSFQALCDIVGQAFFAFSMITGARITALTVDRRNPDNTVVDFVVGAGDDEGENEPQRANLAEFRQRLVGALLTDDVMPPPPERDTEHEALQLHIGVRYLLLAPLYGYSLRKLIVEGKTSRIEAVFDGVTETYELGELRARIRAHVREELEKAASGNRASAIDLTKVAQAEMAAKRGDHSAVLQLLGSWPAPLAIFLRTPEGQMLSSEARALIAQGLGLLGSACVELGEQHQGEEVMRLGIQYAHDGSSAADLFRRLGKAQLEDGREGEALGPLRRAAKLGAAASEIWPLLARGFLGRKRYVAALACIREARAAGVSDSDMIDTIRETEAHLGPALTAWRGLVVSTKG